MKFPKKKLFYEYGSIYLAVPAEGACPSSEELVLKNIHRKKVFHSKNGRLVLQSGVKCSERGAISLRFNVSYIRYHFY